MTKYGRDQSKKTSAKKKKAGEKELIVNLKQRRMMKMHRERDRERNRERKRQRDRVRCARVALE